MGRARSAFRASDGWDSRPYRRVVGLVERGSPIAPKMVRARSPFRAEFAKHPLFKRLSGSESCQRLLRALCVEIHEGWIEQHRYLNMELLKEHRKKRLEVKAA